MSEYKVIGIDTAVNLLVEVFGQPVYVISQGSNTKTDGYGYHATIIDKEEYDRISMFGTPVVGTFTIESGTHKVYEKLTSKLENKKFGSFEFPLATIVDFQRDKNITKTPTIGSSGTVKEIFGFEDWKISIRGICLDDPTRQTHKTAKEQQTALIEINEIAGNLEIKKGKIFTDKLITNIVIESLSFTAVQGKPNMIQYEIQATSDENFLLTETV